MALKPNEHTPSSGFKELKTYVRIVGVGETARAEFFDFFEGEYYVNRATGELFKGTVDMFLHGGGVVITQSAPDTVDTNPLVDPNASNTVKASPVEHHKEHQK